MARRRAQIDDGAEAAAAEARRSICWPAPRADGTGAAGTVPALFPHIWLGVARR